MQHQEVKPPTPEEAKALQGILQSIGEHELDKHQAVRVLTTAATFHGINAHMHVGPCKPAVELLGLVPPASANRFSAAKIEESLELAKRMSEASKGRDPFKCLPEVFRVSRAVHNGTMTTDEAVAAIEALPLEPVSKAATDFKEGMDKATEEKGPSKKYERRAALRNKLNAEAEGMSARAVMDSVWPAIDDVERGVLTEEEAVASVREAKAKYDEQTEKINGALPGLAKNAEQRQPTIVTHSDGRVSTKQAVDAIQAFNAAVPSVHDLAEKAAAVDEIKALEDEARQAQAE